MVGGSLRQESADTPARKDSRYLFLFLCLAKRSIDVAPMADIVNSDLEGLAIDLVHNPIVTDTKTIESFSALKLG